MRGKLLNDQLGHIRFDLSLRADFQLYLFLSVIHMNFIGECDYIVAKVSKERGKRRETRALT
jgi:hypothetical protein